jgi:cysteine-rich repeat protein
MRILLASFFLSSALLFSGCTAEIATKNCGNNTLDEGEQCDDGNQVSDDGCSAFCFVEFEDCTDNLDNDGDTLTDCDDVDCVGDPSCGQPPEPQDGTPCAQDNQCQGQLCLTETDFGFPAGYCSESCSLQNPSCVSGSFCTDVGFGNGTGLCLATCVIGDVGDCRNGYSCQDGGDGQGICFPACTAAAQCPTTDNCSVEIGFCTEPENCDNNQDDDFDDLSDCADSDCAEDPACQNNNGGGAAPLTTIDLGAVPTGQTTNFTVPAGTVGFTILVEGDQGVTYGVERLVKPDGTVLVNGFGSNTLVIFPSDDAYALVMPQNDIGANAVTTGTWQFRIGASQNDNPNVKVLLRGSPFSGGAMDVKIYLPQGLRACASPGCNNGQGTLITAANATTFAEIQGTLNTYFSEFYADEGGFSEGNVEFFDVNNSAFLDIGSQAELDNLFRQSSIGGDGGLHYFLVQSFSGEFGGGVAGIASGIPGAITTSGNRNSATAVEISGDTDTDQNITGLTMAHEGGHFLGLFHTTEFSGGTDDISDTPACPAGTIGGGNLGQCPDIVFMMFPSLASQMRNISNGQLLPIRGGPVHR